MYCDSGKDNCCSSCLICVYECVAGPPFAFNLTGNDLKLADATSSFWASFASTGVPAAPGVWPLYRAATDSSIRLDWPLSVVVGLKNDTCDFWDTIGYG